MTKWEKVKRDGQKIKMFRCVQDPMIGPRPKQAFMLPDLPNWEAYLAPTGIIHVKTEFGRFHAVGEGNWASIEFYAEDLNGEIQDTRGENKKENEEGKRPGRPRLQPSSAV